MQVILREDIEKVGLRGEVVDVAPGFARNYLLPRRLAEPAAQEEAAAAAEAEEARAAEEAATEAAVAEAEADKAEAEAQVPEDAFDRAADAADETEADAAREPGAPPE